MVFGEWVFFWFGGKFKSENNFELCFVESCSIDYRGQWPVGMPDSDLTWNPNAKEGQSGPKYRLFSQKDVRSVLPNTLYKCE